MCSARKPLALNYDDAVAMFDLAAQQHRVLTVGTHFRFTSTMRAAKAHVDGGFFGKIYAVRSMWQRRNGIPGFGSWFTNRDLAGGGSLLDIGVHTLDRALYLMNYPKPVTVSGATFAEFGPRGLGLGGWGADIVQPARTDARFDVDDLAWAFIRFVDGSVLQFGVSWASHFPETFSTELYRHRRGRLCGQSGQNRTVHHAQRSGGHDSDTGAGGQDQLLLPVDREFRTTSGRRSSCRNRHSCPGAIQRSDRRCDWPVGVSGQRSRVVSTLAILRQPEILPVRGQGRKVRRPHR